MADLEEVKVNHLETTTKDLKTVGVDTEVEKEAVKAGALEVDLEEVVAVDSEAVSAEVTEVAVD